MRRPLHSRSTPKESAGRSWTMWVIRPGTSFWTHRRRQAAAPCQPTFRIYRWDGGGHPSRPIDGADAPPRYRPARFGADPWAPVENPPTPLRRTSPAEDLGPSLDAGGVSVHGTPPVFHAPRRPHCPSALLPLGLQPCYPKVTPAFRPFSEHCPQVGYNARGYAWLCAKTPCEEPVRGYQWRYSVFMA